MRRLLDAIDALRARAEAAEAEANRLAEQLENADSRLAELEETVDRLRAAPCPCGEYTMSGARISHAPKQFDVIVRLRAPEDG